MCKSDVITVSHLAQAGIGDSLEIFGGRYTVKTGFDLGDYLVTAPGVAEVVTVWQERDGARRWHCTCAFDLFESGTQDTAACTHVGMVALFLNIRLEVLAGDLGRAVLRMRRLAAKGADLALQAAAMERAGLLSFVYHQRKAATIRRMPYRPAAPAQATEAASAPPPTPAAWFAPRPVVTAPAAFNALVVELWGGTVQVAA